MQSRPIWMNQIYHRSQWVENSSPGFIQITNETGIFTFRVNWYLYKDTTLEVKIPVSFAIADFRKVDFGVCFETLRNDVAPRSRYQWNRHVLNCSLED